MVQWEEDTGRESEARKAKKGRRNKQIVRFEVQVLPLIHPIAGAFWRTVKKSVLLKVKYISRITKIFLFDQCDSECSLRYGHFLETGRQKSEKLLKLFFRSWGFHRKLERRRHDLRDCMMNVL